MEQKAPETYKLKVKSPFTHLEGTSLISEYSYNSSKVEQIGDEIVVTPKQTKYTFKTETKVPKLGVMIVGWGGNNGSTVTAGILANKHNICWNTKKGVKTPNYYGSITQSSTTKVGLKHGRHEINLPLKDVLPMVSPNDFVLGGWDISNMNLADAMHRA